MSTSHKQAAYATVDDHLRNMIGIMKRGAHVTLSGIPDDPTFLSSHFSGNYAKAMAEKIEAALSAALSEGQAQQSVKIPTNADEAEAMEKMGFLWLKEHAPECLTARGLARPPAVPGEVVDVDELAQEIRRIDGNHSLGAGALAEALLPFISRALSAPAQPDNAVAGGEE